MGRRTTVFAVCLIMALVPLRSRAGSESSVAQQILKATGVQGGVIVHVGCGDGKLTAALAANDRYRVHGLDDDEKNVAAARAHIQSLNQYGQVSVEKWSGSELPYIDNCVNLIVAEEPSDVSKEELLRV